jgi:HSP20 family protein
MAEHRRRILSSYAHFVDECNRMRRLGRSPRPIPAAAEGRGRAWVPLADVSTAGDDLVVELELPGIDAGEIDVSLIERTLVVAGERRPAADASFQVRERYTGAFRRTFELPAGTLPEAIEAEVTAGLLTVRVRGGARTERATGPQTIPVQDRTGAPVRRPLG